MNELKYAKSYKDLKKSTLLKKSLQEGDLICVEDEDAIYKYSNGMFEQITATAESNVNVSLYDMNKQIISQIEKMEKDEMIKILDEFVDKNCNVKYFMCLNHEKRYFTLFHKYQEQYFTVDVTFAEAVLECLEAVGEVKTIDKYEDRLEIWVEDKDTLFDFLLFSYDEGVVEFD